MFSMVYKKLQVFLLLFATHSPAPSLPLPFAPSQLSPRISSFSSLDLSTISVPQKLQRFTMALFGSQGGNNTGGNSHRGNSVRNPTFDR